MPVPSTFLKIGNLYEYRYHGTILMVYLGESRDGWLHKFYVMHDSQGAYVTGKLYKITEQQMIRLLHDVQFNEVDTDVTHR